MPKTDIDYSNTIFYKIYCKNPDIKDIYIGHTTNFVQRKYAHKRSCTYEKSANYTCKVYNVIREYGGWDNWKMEIIAFRECADHYEARKVEQQYFEEYNATLNSIEPFPKPKVIQPKPIHVKIEKKLLYCETCNVYFHTKNANDVHTKTNKHIKKVAKANKPAQVSIKIPENAKKFTCEKCEFDCRKLCDYKRYLETAKHNFLTNSNNSSIRGPSTYKCICGNEYKHAPSLCKHKQTCTYNYAQNMPKDAVNYECKKCNFACSKQSNFNAHLSTAKHKKITNDTIILPQILRCECGNEYQYRSGLSRHKKTCTYNSTPPLENTITYTQAETAKPTTDNATEPASDKLFVLVKDLMLQLAIKDKQHEELITHMVTKDKQLAELQNTMKEMIPHLGNNNTSNINSNNNTTFNVQFYLENECKDALSIQEFVKRIEINMDHLRTIAKDGYVDSVSNILIKALNNMAITERPLHCTDLKRETVYIKNNETWNKSTADEPLMNGLINTIENKHYAVVKHYVQTTPAARELDTPEYNFYAKACVHALGNYEDHDKLNKKIYKKVLPEIKLDKSVI